MRHAELTTAKSYTAGHSSCAQQRGGSLDLGAPEPAVPTSATKTPDRLRRSAPNIDASAPRTFSILILGDPGSGKTTLASVLGKPFTDSDGRQCSTKSKAVYRSLFQLAWSIRWEEGTRNGSAKTFSSMIFCSASLLIVPEMQRDLYTKAEVAIVVLSLHGPDKAAEYEGYLRELMRHSTKSNNNQFIVLVANKKDLVGPGWADTPEGSALLESVYGHFSKMERDAPRCGWFVLSAHTSDGVQMFKQALLSTLSKSQLSRDLMMPDPRPECPVCHMRCLIRELNECKAKALPLKCNKCVAKAEKEKKEAEDKAKIQEEEQRMAEERAKLKAEKDQYQLGIAERLAMAKFNSENVRSGLSGV